MADCTSHRVAYGDIELRNGMGRVVGRVWNRLIDGDSFHFVVQTRRGKAPTFREAKSAALRLANQTPA